MKVENSIKETVSSTTVKPTTDTEEIIKAICEWNWIIIDEFRAKTWNYVLAWKDNDGNTIYVKGDTIVNPIGIYLMQVYDWKPVVFEKWNDKYFGRLTVRGETTRYMLWEKVIEIPYRIRAIDDETGEWIIIFPKTSDIIQEWMRGLFVVSPGRAERQKLEKEIMAKMIQLAQVRGWNEIISTQNVIEELQASLKKGGIKLTLENELLYLDFPRRKIRDTEGQDNEYIAPPIRIKIDFANKCIECKGYSSHGFGTPNSRWNPCRWNWDNDIYHCLQDCDIRWLINLIISWSYGYNSEDVWMSHEWRHPLAKLRDYVWYLYDNKDKKEEIKEMVEHLWEVKHDLNIDDWLDGCSWIKDFISSLEWNNETAE